MSAFTHEQQRLIASTFGPLFQQARFEALNSEGEPVKDGEEGTTCVRCRIKLDSAKTMVEVAMGVGGTDYQLNALATLKHFVELKSQTRSPAVTSEFGWHTASENTLSFLEMGYSLYWYRRDGERQGGIQISLWLKGTQGHMSLQKPQKSRGKKEAVASATPASTASDAPAAPKWGQA